ncbi:hypothetical protein, partial [Oleiphilus sp. HI0079]|uniref:hypothetical protein n=1 Tax=Oleiphilus sp. HI0079 TaxID=1822254 RepID=UPI001E3DA819
MNEIICTRERLIRGLRTTNDFDQWHFVYWRKEMEASRPGKLAGGGFYEYPKNGKKHLWNGL